MQNRASIVENALRLEGEGCGTALFRERYGGVKIGARDRVEEGARWKSGLFHVEQWGLGATIKLEIN